MQNKIGQTKGAHKGNNYSQDQLSMGSSRGDIFIDQYDQDSSYKGEYILNGDSTSYLTLEINA